MDVEIEEMCSKHSKGKPVTITRGGNRVRLRAVMPNGGVALVTYDTRVTSQVCGRVIYVHRDNTEVTYHSLSMHPPDVLFVGLFGFNRSALYNTVEALLLCVTVGVCLWPHKHRAVYSKLCGVLNRPSVAIVLATRDRQVIANDKGEVVVRPRGMWEGQPVHAILAGPNSSMPPNCAQPDLLIGTYKFDCFKGEMESEDTDRNRFVLDLTKTAFLREGFSISRVGGSTADGANSPTAPNEKGEGNRRPSSRGSSRASSRPSSGKVEVTGISKGIIYNFHAVMGGVD